MVPCEVECNNIMLDVKGKVKEETRKIGDDNLRIGNSVVENKINGGGDKSVIFGGESNLEQKW